MDLPIDLGNFLRLVELAELQGLWRKRTPVRFADLGGLGGIRRSPASINQTPDNKPRQFSARNCFTDACPAGLTSFLCEGDQHEAHQDICWQQAQRFPTLVPLPDLNPGDMMYARNIGAYSIASANPFNNMPRAKVVSIHAE